jgi:formylglycine-generating enzyme required for sulfatase activity
MYSMTLTRRSFLRGAGAALAVSRIHAIETPELYGLDALLDGSGVASLRAGEFLMGSETGLRDARPVHRVSIGAFDMGKFEVTQAQWESVMVDPHLKSGKALATPMGHSIGSDPSHFKDPFLPVDSVSWDDIQVFFRRLNARDSAHTWRLPTEAEWEYAARAGSTDQDLLKLRVTAWYKENSNEHTQQVGKKQPNLWGLYDMDGNVSEWVADWYGYDYYGDAAPVNPTGPSEGSYRVYRGGCWFDTAEFCNPTLRRFDFPVSRFYNVGFRVVRTTRGDRNRG